MNLTVKYGNRFIIISVFPPARYFNKKGTPFPSKMVTVCRCESICCPCRTLENSLARTSASMHAHLFTRVEEDLHSTNIFPTRVVRAQGLLKSNHPSLVINLVILIPLILSSYIQYYSHARNIANLAFSCVYKYDKLLSGSAAATVSYRLNILNGISRKLA
ncbi:hypothetical protein L873DRAFT_1204256 [Choiromyces venosus 120613-1]|uniref:Uncharacterized protein n=1 Tax=Choiromyces venosus 120613-1 TaxID=1336337 RepID=A0A3N4JEC8_9PEZI|nr:hypothetical protein L873DRAFT_1204256 [Choiromyces venosus 120613-1]